MTGMIFQGLQTDPVRMSGWMIVGNGGKLEQTLGYVKDQSLAACQRRLHAFYPSFAPDMDVLTEQARDRHVLTFPGESKSGLEERVRDWLVSAKDAGLPYGVLREVQRMWSPAVPRVRLVQGSHRGAFAAWYTLDPDGTFSYLGRSPENWDWDSAWTLGAPEPSSIHRFFVIVYAPDGVVPLPIGSTFGPGKTWGSGQVTPQFGYAVKRVSEFVKSAGSLLWGWILAFDPASFDPTKSNVEVPGGYPDGTWFRAYKIGGEWNRLKSARYYCTHPPIP